MAINVSFNGATIFKPGAYSKTNIDLGGGFPIGPAGLIAVIGEADAGTPGAQEINISNVRYTADQISVIRDKYRSGPIADSASMLFAPAADAAIPSGAQTVWFYKTNASTRAELALATSYGTAKAIEWGIGGNRITVEVDNVDEVAPVITGATIAGFGVALDGATFAVRINGATASTITLGVGGHATIGALVTELDGMLTGITPSDGGSDNLILTMDAQTNPHLNGWGAAVELIELNPGDLALLGLVEGQTASSVESASLITLDHKRDLITEEDTVGGNVVLTIGRDGSGAVTAAKVVITDDEVELYEGAVKVYGFVKTAYGALSEMVAEINLKAGWTAAVTSTLYGQLPLSILDQVVNVACFSAAGLMPGRIKKDAADVQEFFDLSSMVSLSDPGVVGLPDVLAEVSLAGGVRGATAPADIVAGLEKFTKFHVNFVVPLFSRDAAADIADGLTDAASTYTIDGIHQAIKTHISLMKTTKKRSERQGILGYKASYVDCKTKAGNLADGRLQLLIQDVRQVDVQGNIKWFQPHMQAAMVAGARGGAPIGEPLTFKFFNVAGVRHTAQAMTTAEEDIVIDFDPDLQTDDAIQSGITFFENPQTGGYRMVVDNTTYGRDANWVWNRGNVIYAGDIVAFNFRNQMESIFVGRKNTVTVADIAGVASSILGQYLAQGITVSTADAPQGYKNLIIRIVGNTIYVEVTVKLVEGIDFILAEITLERATA